MKLRKRTPINYFEADEPSFDEYVYCDKCGDFVFEYCSIHGPLLIIPDDQVLDATVSSVPRSALTIPRTFLHLAPSVIPGAGLGVFSSVTLPRDVRFGPYCGADKEVASIYSWQIYSEDYKPSHVVEASDGDASNWMRYVNCARHWREQNLVAYQYQGQIYYRSIKLIPRFTELLVFYGSEFAATLGVDLARYNSEEFQKCGVKQLSAGTAKQQEVITPFLEKHTNPSENCSSEDTFISNLSIPYKCDDEKNSIEEDKIICYKESNKEISIEKITYFDEEISNEEEICVQTVKYTAVNLAPAYNAEKLKIINEQECKFEMRANSCHICFKSFAKLYGLKRHYLTHIRSDTHTLQKSICANTYICDVCGYPCESKNNLIRHTYRKHTIKKCHICNKEFSDKAFLARHLTNHFKFKKHNCPKCDFQTDFVNKLHQHLRTHMTEKTYKCDKCNYNTYRRDCIVRHVKIHFTNKP